MDTRPDHAASFRSMAHLVARDLVALGRSDADDDRLGLSAFFRTHAAWRSHGFHGDASKARMKEICRRVFACEPDDHRAFVRGLRSVAGIAHARPDDPPATISDRDVFWSCVAALSAETGVAMPTRPPESNRTLRGH